MLHALAWQMLGQRLATRVLRFRVSARAGRRFSASEVGQPDFLSALSAHALQLFEGQFELADRLVQLFGAAAELHAAQLSDHQFEVFDLGLLSAEQLLRKRYVVGLCSDRRRDRNRSG